MAKRKKKNVAEKWLTRQKRRGKRLALTLVVLFALQLVLTFVPYEQVPSGARPVYNELVAFRNRLVLRSGLPISTYRASARVVNGDANVEIFFAPSPGIDDELAGFIDGAQESVLVCIYDLDLPNVVEALVAARARGADVRLIVDSDNKLHAALRPLLAAGILIVGDERSAIMHDKFVVVDEQRLWTGSYNFTHNGTTRNDNNALIIDSPLLAANYVIEFDEMWNGNFGPTSPPNTVNPRLRFSELEVRTFFAPEDRVMEALVDLVAEAEGSIDVMAFSFTSDALAQELVNRRADGLAVRCLFDYTQAQSEYSQDEALAKAGIEVRISRNRRGVMHHKVIIVDQRYVVTGSFNFSRNADTSNDENLLILDSPVIAAIYGEEFRRCWDGVKGY